GWRTAALAGAAPDAGRASRTLQGTGVAPIIRSDATLRADPASWRRGACPAVRPARAVGRGRCDDTVRPDEEFPMSEQAKGEAGASVSRRGFIGAAAAATAGAVLAPVKAAAAVDRSWASSSPGYVFN